MNGAFAPERAVSASDVAVEVVRNADRLLELRAEWNDLLRDSDSDTVFLTRALAVRAAAALTSPAASIERAIGFCASSAARAPASFSASGKAPAKPPSFFFEPP